MKILLYALGAVAAILLVLYFTLFFNLQDEKQQALNAAWQQFSVEIGELGELVEEAPFNNDEQASAEGYRHMAAFLPPSSQTRPIFEIRTIHSSLVFRILSLA